MTPDELMADVCPRIHDTGWAFFFAPETLAKGKELGLDGFRFYFLGRGGVLGDVDAAVVCSAFGYFEPALVERIWDSARAVMAPRDAGRAFLACGAEFGRARFSDLDGMAAFCAAADAVNEAADPVGLALYAAARAEPLADDAPAHAMQILSVLRELRGSAHLLAVRACGLDARTAHCVARPQDLGLFGWPDDAVRRRDRHRPGQVGGGRGAHRRPAAARVRRPRRCRPSRTRRRARPDRGGAGGMSEPELSGRVAVVTGGAAGIGRGITRQLAAAGAIVVVNDVAPDLLAAAVEEIAAADGRAIPVEGDIRDPGTVGRLADAAAAVDDGRIDILVNNVGDYRPNGRFLKTSEDAVAGAVRDQPRARLPLHPRHRAGDGRAGVRQHRERVDRRGLPRHPRQRGVLGVQRRRERLHPQPGRRARTRRRPRQRDRARPDRHAPDAGRVHARRARPGDGPPLGAAGPVRSSPTTSPTSWCSWPATRHGS